MASSARDKNKVQSIHDEIWEMVLHACVSGPTVIGKT